MRLTATCSLVSAMLCLVLACSKKESPDAINAARVDEVFAQWNTADSPGCAVSATQDGKSIFSKGYGSANLDHDVAITADTLFHVASVSKQFTAAAIALLAIDGKLSLDDDIAAYLPELPDFGAGITIRHLIHHTSGLRDQWDLMILNGWRYSQDLITDRDVLSVIAKQKTLNFPPGEQFRYSNTGYTLLARIVERATGNSLRRFTREKLFEPLGMHRTFFRDNFREVVKGQAYGYVDKEPGFELSVTNFDTVGATSLMTTANDLSKWARNLETGEVGGTALLQLMHEQGRLLDDSEVGYAFGIEPGEYRGLTISEHSGSDAGYTAHFMHFPEQGFAVACLCNTPTDAAGLARQVADIYLADALSPAPMSQDRHDPPEAPIELSAELLQARSGTYRQADRDRFFAISASGDRMTIHNWGMQLPLHPITSDRFRVGPYGVYLSFAAGEHGPAAVELVWGEGEPENYVGLDPVRLPMIQREEYIGVYVSEEIGIPYEIGLDSLGELYLDWLKYHRQPLRPASRDLYYSNIAGTLHFTRDANGSVDGFGLSGDRSYKIRFRKQ